MTRQVAVVPRFGRVWRKAARRLDAAHLQYGQGTEDALQEAAWMLIHSLGWPVLASFAQLEALREREVPADAVQRLDALVDTRIATRKPAAYLMGEAWLQGERFVVDARVIVPRSYIAEMLHAGLDPWLADAPRTIVDVCTGSGCLGILAAKRWDQADVLGIDISADALDVARTNIALHAMEDRVRVLASDLLSARPEDSPRVDLMLCNPPYVNAGSMRALPAEFRHEPNLALAGGPDGMDLVRRLLNQAPRHLAPHGVLVVEIGNEREHFEAAFARLPVVWLPTSTPGTVVLVEAADLVRA